MNINAPATPGQEKQGSGYESLEARGKAEDAFLREMLAPIRNQRIWLPALPRAGKTDLILHRIQIGIGPNGRGLDLRAAP